MDEDEVVDYLLMEALVIKVGKEDTEAANKREIEQWKKEGHERLDKHR